MAVAVGTNGAGTKSRVLITGGVDYIVHLAAIVGYPACKRDPRLATEVNIDGTMNLLEVRARSQRILYASTGSNYGAYTGGMCTEETPLNPVSLYGASKTKAEQAIMKSGNSLSFRFATAFGVSSRM